MDMIGGAKELADRISFTCPVCGSVSYNPNDVRERYCGRCHGYTEADPPPGLRWVRFRTEVELFDFGRLVDARGLAPGCQYVVMVGPDEGVYEYDGTVFAKVAG